MLGPMGDEPTDRDGAGGGLRVLLANEPRIYRESMAVVLGELRPGFDVRLSEPEDLEERVLAFLPDVAICSRVVGLVEERVPVWVELYPGHSSGATVSERGRRTEFAQIQLEDLLSVADRAVETQAPGAGSGE